MKIVVFGAGYVGCVTTACLTALLAFEVSMRLRGDCDGRNVGRWNGEILAQLAKEAGGQLSAVKGSSDLCRPPSGFASGSDACASTLNHPNIVTLENDLTSPCVC